MVCSFLLLNCSFVVGVQHGRVHRIFPCGRHLKYFHFVGMISKAPVNFYEEKFHVNTDHCFVFPYICIMRHKSKQIVTS